jgi:hypothetical protein
MPRVGFVPMTPVFEREKTVHGLDRAATVIGSSTFYHASNMFLAEDLGDCIVIG